MRRWSSYPPLLARKLPDLGFDLLDLGRAARPRVEPGGIDQVASSDEQPELAQVQLRDEHLVEPGEHLAQVLWERVEVAQVRAGYGQPAGARTLDGGDNGAVGTAPTQDEQLPFLVADHLHVRDVLGDARDLLRAVGDHAHMVLGIVADVAGDVRL